MLAHGAGAGYLHANMQALAEAFAARGIATLRFNFPYMQNGRRRVDAQALSVATVAAAFDTAHEAYGDLPVFLGGHSYGGRMSTHFAAEHPQVACAGLILCSFPLHTPKKPSRKRAEHLADVKRPMLFLSGTRDDLADAALLTEVTEAIPGARVHWLETANHSYVVLKRSRTNPQPVFEEMGEAGRTFVDQVL